MWTQITSFLKLARLHFLLGWGIFYLVGALMARYESGRLDGRALVLGLATMWLLPVTTSNDTFAQWEADFDAEPTDQAEMVDLVTSIFSEGFASAEEKLGKVP